jgi:type I site-specific restriction endonuclease
MQTHRPLIDRLQLLSSTLSTQLTDSNERERVRRRLNEITRRWTELEQEIISEEENMEEIKNLTELFNNIKITCEQWLKRTRDLIHELTNAKNVETFDQLIPKAKSTLFEYQASLEHLQKLRNRFNRLVQINKTPEATQKVDFDHHKPIKFIKKRN